MNYEQNFPYVYENGHWISTEDGYEHGRFWKIVRMLAGALAISALLWFCLVIFFLI
jgi:hypothetical protein